MRPARRRRSWRVRLARGSAYGFGGLCLLLGLAFGFVHTSWGKEAARAALEKGLGERVRGRVSVGSLDYSLFFRDVVVGDVVIDGRDKRPAIALERLSVALDRGSLLAGAPALDRAELDGVRLHVRERADGSSNLSGLFVSGGEQARPAIAVHELAVRDLEASVQQADGSRVDLYDLDLSGSLSTSPSDRALHVDLDRVRASAGLHRKDGTSIVVPELSTSARIERHGDRARATLGATRAEALVSSPRLKRPRRVELGLEALAAQLETNGLALHLSNLRAGPLSVESFRVKGALDRDERALAGEQTLELRGLHLDARALADLAGVPILGSDIDVTLTAAGPADALMVDGAVQSAEGVLRLDGELDLSTATPAYQASLVGGAELEAGALPAAPDMPPLQSPVLVHLEGRGVVPGAMDADLDVAVGPTRIGSLPIDGLALSASARGGALTLDNLSARIAGIELSGRGALTRDRDLSARLQVSGDVAGAAAALAGAGAELPALPLQGPIDLAVTARGNLDGPLELRMPQARFPIAGGAVRVRGRAELSAARELKSLDAAVSLEKLSLEDLLALAGRPAGAAGELGGEVRVSRHGDSSRLDYDLAASLSRPAVRVTARGAVTDRRAVARLEAARSRDGARLASAELSLPIELRNGHRLRNRAPWDVDVELFERKTPELAALLPPDLGDRVARLGGALAARIDLAGTPSRPAGTVDVTFRGARRARLRATLSSSADGIAIAADARAGLGSDSKPLAILGGTVRMPAPIERNGRLDWATAAAAAELDLALSVPRRPISSLAGASRSLGDIPGAVSGQGTLRGPVTAPAVDLALEWARFATAGGAPGRARLSLSGDPRSLAAKLSLGAADPAVLEAIIAPRGGDRIGVEARAKADAVSIDDLLPAAWAGELESSGRLDWDMTGAFELARSDQGLELVSSQLAGALSVKGAALPVPGSDRLYQDISADLVAEPDGLRLASLSAREQDASGAERRIEASGRLAMADLRPERLHLDLRADDWLLFGASLGPADAPRAELDADLGVDVNLRARPLAVDVIARQLELRDPDRHARAHWPETSSVAGDVIFVDDPSQVGKLPVPPVPAETSGQGRRRPMDIQIHIPKPVRLQRAPLDLVAQGDVAIAVRDQGVRVRGGVRFPEGALRLLGKKFALRRGELRFDKTHPHGRLDLEFAGKLPPATMRDVSLAGAERDVVFRFQGAPAAPEVSLDGVANAALLDVMAAENAGGPRFRTAPDLPASATVQAPRGDQPMVLTYLSSHLPHLLFFDRFAAWADPYDGPDAYGRVRHFEGESYAADGKSRVRAVARPPTPGRSQAELQLDRLLWNNDRSVAGVGLRAGDRLGGGVGVFFEWVSDD